MKELEDIVVIPGKSVETGKAYRDWVLLHTELREPSSERRRRIVERDDHGEQLFAHEVGGL